MNNNSQDKTTIRKPYHKPQMEQVQLIAEEAVLTGCKLQGGGSAGPQNTNCKGVSEVGGGDCLTQGS